MRPPRQNESGDLYCPNDYGVELGPLPRLEPDLAFASDTGLILPNGRFYACNYSDHSFTYRRLIDQDLVPDGDWLTHGKCLHISERYMQNLKPYLTPTQAQINAVFDWVQVEPARRKFPDWLQRMMDAQ